jgi:hypothetical protein
MAKHVLLNDVTEDTTSSWVQCAPGAVQYFIYCDDFGSGTVKLQVSDDDGSHYCDIANSSTEVQISDNMYLAGTAKIRAVFSGATSPAAMRVVIDEGNVA